MHTLPDRRENTAAVLNKHNEHTIDGNGYREYEKDTDARVGLQKGVVVRILVGQMNGNGK